MPFSLTQNPFNTWVHIQKKEDLSFLEKGSLGITYLLHLTKDSIVDNATQFQALLVDSFDLSEFTSIHIPLDIIWRVPYGPMQFSDIKQTHQIRLVFPPEKIRGIIRLLKGSHLSNRLWRIIPTNSLTGLPYSETSLEFIEIKQLFQNTNIHIQGIEQTQYAEDVGQEIKIDNFSPTVVNDWTYIIERSDE